MVAGHKGDNSVAVSIGGIMSPTLEGTLSHFWLVTRGDNVSSLLAAT